jgi:hypothetical protein
MRRRIPDLLRRFEGALGTPAWEALLLTTLDRPSTWALAEDPVLGPMSGFKAGVGARDDEGRWMRV